MTRWMPRLDWMLLLIMLCLAVFGLVTLYAAVHQGGIVLWQRQVIYWLVGLSMFFIVCLIPIRLLALMTWPAYLGALLALLLVPVLGEVQMGARRWLDLGVINVQPSELMKWALMLLMAHWFASRHASSLRDLSLALLFAVLPAGLIVIQPDLGTTLLLLLSATVMVFAAGLPWRWAAYGAAASLISLPVLWLNMHTYQKQRVLSFLDPEADPLGAGYHVIQSSIAIGSGGVFGKGYLHGTQARLHFLPEQHTDFIFAVLAEEGGLIASGLLLLLYGLLISRIVSIASRAATRFGAMLCIGVAAIFSLYVCINIGMVSGVMPVVGVPLPFVSYGGSALITMLAALGMVMRVHIESRDKLPWQRPGSPFA
ncbi:MAG: rod shape-determining protein RodA [Zetaproteobacteria bacterium CG06_land_8_20_14_3_00_59_53]|nr:MAG: rod shape-determining protein RodA [Zetaproteobacteria bacterium CG2_30_59_37]PIO88787.1 MAG: rod shape-determining protein RodA [Zetaproteobacteria bacterium CG23_combo_of_CG06-09_8_20_14_all_59_86]PIQ64511.1 MAG: rod shape-determining protein RodA [Zetaproteobacteria bacterium CG11_big_fil_rev_8_21_14_0_20_59_439]PIU70018.1 MAG: rod shape-determining protein RodA [Zetaproteobacteria bacterium CG06_land_8_20_14_3_00_59_53]PIU97975.1 MAG: rod shape-determining protein RodA [Zetaproteoba